MGFSFGLFRFLTWGNIAVQAFLLFFSLYATIVQPVMGAFYLMVFGTVFYHNYLCLQLQKAFKDPAVPLRPTFSASITIFSVLSFIIAMLTFWVLSMIVTDGREAFYKGMADSTRGNKDITPEVIHNVFNFLVTIVGIYGVAIATNCILSSVFLNRWKKAHEQQEQEDADSFLDV